MRREGLYSSRLTTWQREREEGQLAGLAPKKRGCKPQRSLEADELTRLQRESARLQQELAKANTVIEVQRQVAALLAEAMPAPAEDFARAPAMFEPGRLDIRRR